MEESVALDSAKQKKFVKSVRGIKKLLKRNSKKLKERQPSKDTESIKPKNVELIEESKPTAEENDVKRLRKNKSHKKIRRVSDKGLVYLSHIPHGFYEHQMTEYFKQFGGVTNVRVIKSKRTGNSKGYAFIEFKEPTVAEIVAETMNNYLMGKRLLKAVYIPPEKQRRHALRKNWNAQNNPGSEKRLIMKKVLNANKSDQEELRNAKKLLFNLSKNKEKLKELGIDYDFFTPVDIPDELKDDVNKNEVEIKEDDSNDELEKKIKIEKKVKPEQDTVKTESKENKDTTDVKTEKPKRKKKKAQTKSTENLQTDNNFVQKLDANVQKTKGKKVNEGKKAPEDFITVDDADSDNNDDIDFDEIVELENIEKKKTVNKKKATLKSTIKNKKNEEVSTDMSKKRRNSISAPVIPKKAKFEKQNKKTISKVVKKRK